MNEWITDRRPTVEDADDDYVWVTTEHGNVLRQRWDQVGQRPWLPRARPEPYVKPKPWVAVWSEQFASWKLDGPNYQHLLLAKLTDREAHAEAAERIAEIYNGVTS